MGRQCAVAHALLTHHAKGSIEAHQKLGFKLAINLTAQIFIFYVATNIGIEQNRVRNLIAVFPKAANRNIHIQTDPLIYYAEGDGAGSTILVANNFLSVKKVNPLVLARVATIGEAFANL